MKAHLTQESISPAMMRPLLAARALGAVSLDPGLRDYVADGLVLLDGRALVSARAAAADHSASSHFQDATGFEVFVNKIHIDDWASKLLASQSAAAKLAHAIELASAVADSAGQLGYSIAAYISVGPRRDVVFRFHRHRLDEPPWTDDVRTFREALLCQQWVARADDRV